MSEKKFRVKRPFACKDPLFRGKILVNPDYKNLGQLVRQGFLEELPGGGGDDEGAAAVIETEIQTEITETNSEINSESNIQETGGSEIQTEEIQIESPVETIVQPVEETAAETAAETVVENVTEVEVTNEPLTGEPTQEQPEEAVSKVPAEKKEVPELRKGDTVAKLVKRYGKQQLLDLAGTLKVTVKTDNNRDEIATKILASKAAKKIVG